MVFYPRLVGWPVEHDNDWQEAASYFYQKALDEGQVVSAWNGQYQYQHFGGHNDDLIDVYCYSNTDAQEEGLQVAVHFHVSGPCVWSLQPFYQKIDELPELFDHTMIVSSSGGGAETFFPIEVINRHVLSPNDQIKPFLAQVCFLAQEISFYTDMADYQAHAEKNQLFPIIPGGIFAPHFLLSQMKHAVDMPNDASLQLTPEEKRILICGFITALETHPINDTPFILRLLIDTPLGCLTICCNYHQVGEKAIHVGDICYAVGILSADVAIYQNAGGYGH